MGESMTKPQSHNCFIPIVGGSRGSFAGKVLCMCNPAGRHDTGRAVFLPAACILKQMPGLLPCKPAYWYVEACYNPADAI